MTLKTKCEERKLEKNEYRCARCGGIFIKGQTDEECLAEMKSIWGDIPENERVVICDDCFNNRTTKEIKKMGEEYKSTIKP
jgi:DNA-directed RNA polymerase subunit RPC12/RpoP